MIATTAQDATAFPFGRTAPHAVLNAVFECIFQALEAHLAAGANAPSGLDTESVGQGDGDGDYVSMMRSNAQAIVGALVR